MSLSPGYRRRSTTMTGHLTESMKVHGFQLNTKSRKNAHSETLLEMISEEKLCLFCLGEEGKEEDFGGLIHHKSSGIRIHYFCLLLASGLKQCCDDESVCDMKETPDTIYGFLIQDIFKEFRRGSMLRCTICQKYGANIGCAVQKCKSSIHFKCGLERRFLFQYFGSYVSYCRKHKPSQCQSLLFPDSTRTCDICFEDIAATDVLVPPCCQNASFHRNCIKKQAFSSGLHFFRCPMCNNKDDFTNEMLRMGIYVPDCDASWETPDAFSDLLEHTILCDITHCKCTHGRKYDRTGTIWSISVCLLCGSSGAHVACGMLKTHDSPYVCEICTSVHGQTGVRKTLRDMGFDPQDSVLMMPCTRIENGSSKGSRCDESENRNYRVTTRSQKRRRESQTASELDVSFTKKVRC